MIFRLFFAYLKQRASWRAKPSFLYVYLDNKNRLFNPFSILSHFSRFLKNPEKSAELYGEGNERQLCVGVSKMYRRIVSPDKTRAGFRC